jgi:hypothetical protein
VVSLPAPVRYVERHYEDERALRRRKIAGAVEMKALPAANSPAEALDRLTIPADAMARITEALSTGGSIIVSDQGITPAKPAKERISSFHCASGPRPPSICIGGWAKRPPA